MATRVPSRFASDVEVHLQKNGHRLKDFAATKRVFIAPDRTREERIERGKLVNFIREKRNSDPINFYYISGTTVLRRERAPKTTANTDVVTQPQTGALTASTVHSEDVVEKQKINFRMCC